MTTRSSIRHWKTARWWDARLCPLRVGGYCQQWESCGAMTLPLINEKWAEKEAFMRALAHAGVRYSLIWEYEYGPGTSSSFFRPCVGVKSITMHTCVGMISLQKLYPSANKELKITQSVRIQGSSPKAPNAMLVWPLPSILSFVEWTGLNWPGTGRSALHQVLRACSPRPA